MNKTTADEKMARLLDVLASGKTVYISTSLRCTKITQRNVESFARAGHPLFRATNGSLWMASGKKYVCIDYCRFEVA